MTFSEPKPFGILCLIAPKPFQILCLSALTFFFCSFQLSDQNEIKNKCIIDTKFAFSYHISNKCTPKITKTKSCSSHESYNFSLPLSSISLSLPHPPISQNCACV